LFTLSSCLAAPDSFSFIKNCLPVYLKRFSFHSSRSNVREFKMRDTMRDGKAGRSASNRSKAPKEPLSRAGITSSRLALTRAPSSVDATIAAEAAIDRLGTPMHSASVKPRNSPPKPQPVRRPTRNNTPPTTIFEDVDLEVRSMNSSSLDSSKSSCSTGPRKYSYDTYDDAPAMDSMYQATGSSATGQGTPPSRSMGSASSSSGFWGAIKDFFVLWKEVNHLGPSEEVLAITIFRKKFSSKERDVERGSPHESVPRVSASREPYSGQDVRLQQFSSASDHGYHGPSVPTIVKPPAAITRSRIQRVVLPNQRPGSVTSAMTTFTQFINYGKPLKQAPASSALRQEVRYDSPQEAAQFRGRGKECEESPTQAVRYLHEAQAPRLYENRNFIREHDIDQGSFVGGFSDFDGAHRAPTMVSSYTNMSHVDPNDWQTLCTEPRPGPGPSHARALSPSGASSVYSRATDGRAYTDARPGSPPPNMPRILGEYRTLDPTAPPSNPWRKSRPVSPISETYPSLVGNSWEHEPVSPLQQQRDDGRLGSYVPARHGWPQQRG
jgi:hypothetical protein